MGVNKHAHVLKTFSIHKMDKKTFIDSIQALKLQSQHDNKFSDTMRQLFETDSPYIEYKSHWVKNQLINVLQVAMDDDHAHSWIEYYINELDFGANKSKTSFELSTAENLYDYLTELKQEKLKISTPPHMELRNE